MDGGEVAQELINYGRKYGPLVSFSSKFEPTGVRLAAVSLAPGHLAQSSVVLEGSNCQ